MKARSMAQPKQPSWLVLIASRTSRIEPISNTVAPMKAVMPPPYRISLGNSLLGRTSGSQAKKPLMTQMTEPRVKITATR